MQVDFYVMEDMGRVQALRELCLLLEKPYECGETIYIHTTTLDEAEQLDKLLWTYRDDRFLAHQIINNESNTSAPIEIGISRPDHHKGTLVNLTSEIPEFYQQFSRVIEPVFSEPAAQQASRDRFRQYRDQGCELKTHKMKVT